MTTIVEPTTPTLKEFALMRISSLAKSRAKRSADKRAMVQASAFLATVRVVLHLAGFALLTIAGFEWNMIAGWVVAGASCFLLSTLLTPEAPDRR